MLRYGIHSVQYILLETTGSRFLGRRSSKCYLIEQFNVTRRVTVIIIFIHQYRRRRVGQRASPHPLDEVRPGSVWIILLRLPMHVSVNLVALVCAHHTCRHESGDPLRFHNNFVILVSHVYAAYKSYIIKSRLALGKQIDHQQQLCQSTLQYKSKMHVSCDSIA